MKNQLTISQRAFSLTDLLLVIAALIGIATVILPAMSRPRTSHCKINCTNNLKQTALAFRIWAGDNNDKFPMQLSATNGGVQELAAQGSAYAVFLIMSNELNTPKILYCPAENNPTRRMATSFAPTDVTGATGSAIPFTETNSLSYFVGLDAEDLKPSTFLSGDDHFAIAGAQPNRGLWPLGTNTPVEWRDERHPKQGNVALADGSVQGFSTAALRKALANTGIETNRLVMP